MLGVFDNKWVKIHCEVLKNLGSKHALVVSGQDGLDEISIAAPTNVSELRNGEIFDYVISPDDFGFAIQSIETLRVDSVKSSFDLIKSALIGEQGSAYDMVALNAGATIYAANLTKSLKDGVIEACRVLDSGAGLKKMHELAEFTNQFRQE